MYTKAFANFHVHHYGEECILKIFANFNVRNYCDLSKVKLFANFHIHTSTITKEINVAGQQCSLYKVFG